MHELALRRGATNRQEPRKHTAYVLFDTPGRSLHCPFIKLGGTNKELINRCIDDQRRYATDSPIALLVTYDFGITCETAVTTQQRNSLYRLLILFIICKIIILCLKLKPAVAGILFLLTATVYIVFNKMTARTDELSTLNGKYPSRLMAYVVRNGKVFLINSTHQFWPAHIFFHSP